MCECVSLLYYVLRRIKVVLTYLQAISYISNRSRYSRASISTIACINFYAKSVDPATCLFTSIYNILLQLQ